MYQKSINKIIKSSGVLLSGNVMASILGILVVSILTKNLSLEEYGIIVMVQAYIMLMDQLFNFQSWQALIKYCTNAIENDDNFTFIGYLQIGIVLDFVGSMFAFVLSFVLLVPLSIVLQFDSNLLYPYMIYAVVILTRIIGTPTALLRMSNSYKYFNYFLVINWGLKLGLVYILAYLDTLSIYNVILAFLVSETFSNIILIYYGVKTLKLYEVSLTQIIPSMNTVYFAKQNTRFLSFALRTNMNSAVLGVTRTIDELIVGALINPAAAGIFKIIKLIGSMIARIIDPIYITFYPEINKYVAKNDKVSIRKIIGKVSFYIVIVSFVIFLFFDLFGAYWIEFFFTKKYALELPIMKLYLIGLLFSFILFYVQPLMLSFELEKVELYINTVSSIIYLIALYILTIEYELWGIAISSIVFWITVSLAKLFYLQKKLNLFWEDKI